MNNYCNKCNDSNEDIDKGINIKKNYEAFGNNFKYRKKLYIEKMSKQQNKEFTEEDFYDDLIIYVGSKDSTTFYRWEQGKSFPKVPDLIRLSKMFECTTDDLINEKQLDDEIKLPEENDKVQTEESDETQTVDNNKKNEQNLEELLTPFLEKQNFSKDMISKTIELIYAFKRTTKSQGTLLFGKSKKEKKIYVPDFYNDLILNQEIEIPLNILKKILDVFNKLSIYEINTCKNALDISKEKYKSKYMDDYSLALETIINNLPQDKRDKINSLIDELNIYINIHKSAYILRLFNGVLDNNLE